MKITYRVPTSQFAFLEIVEEPELNLTKEQVVANFNEWEKVYAQSKVPKVGLGDKEYNAFIDAQLNGGSNHVEEYNLMSEEQKNVVQTIKRAMKRLEARNK